MSKQRYSRKRLIKQAQPKPFKFKPNKRLDGPLSPSNVSKTDWARSALDVYTLVMDGRKESLFSEEDCRDLITDLLHLMDREGIEDPEDQIDSSLARWREER